MLGSFRPGQEISGVYRTAARSFLNSARCSIHFLRKILWGRRSTEQILKLLSLEEQVVLHCVLIPYSTDVCVCSVISFLSIISIVGALKFIFLVF